VDILKVQGVIKINAVIIGFVEDSVSEMPRTPWNLPPITFDIESEHIRDVGKLADRLLILLNPDSLLSKGEQGMLSGL
jgi:purine-binding chemotaxis protein CheW